MNIRRTDSTYVFHRVALCSQRFLGFCVVLIFLLGSCERPPSGSSQQLETRNPSQSVSRDLSQDEAAGGHVLRKHVGLTDEQLRERLAEEPNIAAASTYTDRATAERVTGAAIAANRDRIQRWLDRRSGHPNLVLDYDAGVPIGRTLNRGDRQPRPCSHALVVLKYDPPGSYHVLTSYPECRS